MASLDRDGPTFPKMKPVAMRPTAPLSDTVYAQELKRRIDAVAEFMDRMWKERSLKAQFGIDDSKSPVTVAVFRVTKDIPTSEPDKA